MKQLWRGYVSLVEGVCLLGIVVVATLGGVQVWFRYVAGSSLVWSEEIMRFTMIWIVMLGAGLAYSRGQFLGMRVLVESLPGPIRRAADILSAVIMLAFLAVIAWYGWKLADRTRLQMLPTMGLSLIWLNISIVFGVLLLAMHIIRDEFLGWGEPAKSENHE